MSEPALAHLAYAKLDHERLLSLVNSMVDGVIAVDEKVRIDIYNGAALNILDINSTIHNQSLGRYCDLVDQNNQPVDVVELIRSTRMATVNRDLRLRYKDGSTINLYLSIAPVRFGFGKLGKRGYVLLLRDITREKSLEEERDEFISVVSHELRTPITIAEGNISNALFVMGKGGNDDQLKDAMKQAHAQILFLASMINDLSTLSRAERGVLKVEVEPINVHDLVVDLARNYTPDASKKGLSIKTDISPHLEILSSSKLYVREVMQNFITNAVKYTEKGHVTIGAKPADKGVYIWVEDTGIGISHADLERIYDKFFRSEDFRTRQNNGTGLGLYVTMKLARLVHAEITTESELNKGSCFTVFFPDLN
jgi:two-component system, OmpR family, phosphate regulon sensor histidine kinase PhoR